RRLPAEPVVAPAVKPVVKLAWLATLFVLTFQELHNLHTWAEQSLAVTGLCASMWALQLQILHRRRSLPVMDGSSEPALGPQVSGPAGAPSPAYAPPATHSPPVPQVLRAAQTAPEDLAPPAADGFPRPPRFGPRSSPAHSMPWLLPARSSHSG